MMVAVVLVPSTPAQASTATDDEISFVNKLNDLRSGQGVQTLSVDYRLRNVARSWAQQMANNGSISHNPNLASQLPAGWISAGENVGVGGSVDSLHNAFVNSPGHYANMVNSQYNAVGIGVVITDRIWVVVDFMYTNSPIPPDPEVPFYPTPKWVNYRIASAGGRIFGANPDIQEASNDLHPAFPIVAAAATPTKNGEWLAASDGGVFAFGDGQFYGSKGGQPLNQPIVGMAPTASGHGYWLVAADGGIFTFGDARFYGSKGGQPLNQPIVGMDATPSGNGYWLVARDGGIFTFGDARFYGSKGGQALNQPVSGMANTVSGNGYWLVARDGGIFTFGDAQFYGSMGGRQISGNMMGISPTGSGNGYFMVSSGGGIYTYGDAPYEGGASTNLPIVAISQ
jgi:hypothetical protein